MHGLQATRTFRFGYTSHARNKSFSFNYDFTKELYHEKIGSSYIREQGDLKPYIQNLSFIMNHRDTVDSVHTIDLSTIDKGVKRHVNRYLEKSHINLKIDVLDCILAAIQYKEIHLASLRVALKKGYVGLETKSTEYSLESDIKQVYPIKVFQLGLERKEHDLQKLTTDKILESPDVDLSMSAINSDLSREDNLLNVLKNFIFSKEDVVLDISEHRILSKEQEYGVLNILENYISDRKYSILNIDKDCTLSREDSLLNILQDYTARKDDSLLNILESYILDKKYSILNIDKDYTLSREDGLLNILQDYTVRKDDSLLDILESYILEKEDGLLDILENYKISAMKDRDLQYEALSLLLDMSMSEILKLDEDSLVNGKARDALAEMLAHFFIRDMHRFEVRFSNTITSFIKQAKAGHDIVSDVYTHMRDKDTDIPCLISILYRVLSKDIAIEDDIKLDLATLREIMQEIISELLVRDDEIETTVTDSSEIKLMNSTIRQLIESDIITKGVRWIFKDLEIEDVLKDISERDPEACALITDIENILDRVNKESVALVSDPENILDHTDKESLISCLQSLLSNRAFADALMNQIKTLSKDESESLVESNVLTTPNAKNILYEKDTQLIKDAKLIDLEDERQLKLWKRFWFLYASGEIDSKILPYNDFPYETEPIEFSGNEHLYPENWNDTFPHTPEFWKKIDYHPVADGTGEALDQIDLAINIMIEIINVLILMWGKHYAAFWGWTGTQAVLGITGNVYEWLRLETSINAQNDKNAKMHYDRCFRWLRWETEKVALKARYDMELRGNYYVGLLVEELINYMEDHHFNTMPLFIDVNKMDEWRRTFDRDIQGDIPFVLDKIKGVRHKIIVGKERKINE